MSKQVLYIVILALVGVIIYLVVSSGQYFTAEPNTDSEFEFGTTTITDSNDAEVETEPETKAEASPTLIAISGTLVRFQEVPERTTGEVVIYALINDGTEVIQVDMRDVVKPGVTAPEDQLGLKIGQTVTVRGVLDANGGFRASEVE